jgi:hypothetical protein
VITYPREMVFGELEEPQREAIVAAAAELGMAVSEAASVVRVTVRSPMEAYRFGQATCAHLPRGQYPPLPTTPAKDPVTETP